MEVTGITVEKAQEIADASIVSGYIAPGTGHLILVTAGGTEIDAGLVVQDPIDMSDITITGTLAEFNAALSDANFATLLGAESLENKTLDEPIVTNPAITAGSFDSPTIDTPVIESPTITGIGEVHTSYLTPAESVGTAAFESLTDLSFNVVNGGEYFFKIRGHATIGAGDTLEVGLTGPTFTTLSLASPQTALTSSAYDDGPGLFDDTMEVFEVFGYLNPSADGVLTVRMKAAGGSVIVSPLLTQFEVRRIT